MENDQSVGRPRRSGDIGVVVMQAIHQSPTTDWLAMLDSDVHIWCVELNQPGQQLRRFEHLLTPAELERAAGYYQERDRENFIVARGALRLLLSRYQGSDPRRLRFIYGANGKPALDDQVNSGVTFNLSHSRDLALVAVARHRQVGIDLEAVRPDLEVESIAERHFRPQEYLKICSASPAERHHLFFRYWTLKEAYLKALGAGITSLTECPDVEWITDGLHRYSTGWQAVELVPLPGYVGALVIASDKIPVFESGGRKGCGGYP